MVRRQASSVGKCRWREGTIGCGSTVPGTRRTRCRELHIPPRFRTHRRTGCTTRYRLLPGCGNTRRRQCPGVERNPYIRATCTEKDHRRNQVGCETSQPPRCGKSCRMSLTYYDPRLLQESRTFRRNHGPQVYTVGCRDPVLRYGATTYYVSPSRKEQRDAASTMHSPLHSISKHNDAPDATCRCERNNSWPLPLRILAALCTKDECHRAMSTE